MDLSPVFNTEHQPFFQNTPQKNSCESVKVYNKGGAHRQWLLLPFQEVREESQLLQQLPLGWQTSAQHLSSVLSG